MESLRKARARLHNYPLVIAECGPQATSYGRCIALKLDDLKKDTCAKEFEAFKGCLQQASKKLKTKL